MGALNAVLWFIGVTLMAVGFARAQGPYRRYRALQQTDQNIRRYETWRGGRGREARTEVTGADVMRQELRRQLQLWVGVLIVGFVLVFLGFAIGS